MSTDAPGDWFRARREGVDIRIQLTPKDGCDRIDGIVSLTDGARVLTARVRATPDKGAANRALETLLAGALGVARSTVTVASGHRARRKTVHVAGDADTLAGALAALAGQSIGRDRP